MTHPGGGGGTGPGGGGGSGPGRDGLNFVAMAATTRPTNSRPQPQRPIGTPPYGPRKS